MTVSRRALAVARERMRAMPSDAAEIVLALVLSEVEDGDEGALTPSQAARLTWWWATHEEARA